MSGRKSRSKGQRGEREAAREIERVLSVFAHRGRQYSGDQDAPDVKHTIQGLHIEVKRTEKLRLWEAVGQAIEEAGKSVPIVMHRPNNKPWLLIFRFEDLPKLVEVLKKRRIRKKLPRKVRKRLPRRKRL